MASRYDQPTNEPDLDKYETRTDDIDVPDFDAPEPPVDPSESDLYNITRELRSLNDAIDETQDLERLWTLRRMVERVVQQATHVQDSAAAKIDQILERRR